MQHLDNAARAALPSAAKAALEISSRQDLARILSQFNIDPAEWGKTGKSKSLDQLFQEIQEGETTLTSLNGVLKRSVKVVHVDIFTTTPDGEELMLREMRQVFRDGRVRTRTVPTSIMEKVKPGEEGLDAAKRALEEEVGYRGRKSPAPRDSIEESCNSPSYPGLDSAYAIERFRIDLEWREAQLLQLKEEQADKTTEFGWVPHSIA